MGRSRLLLGALALAIGAGFGLGAAGCQRERALVVDPSLVVIDRDKPERVRRDAAAQLWDEVEQGTTERHVARDALKRVMWDRASPTRVRLAAIDALVRDTTPEGEADTATAVGFLMQTEHDRAMVNRVCEIVSARNWTRTAPAIARNAAWWITEDEESNEALPHWDTLRSLHPGEDLDEILFGIFVDADHQAETGEGFSGELADKIRASTWELLARRDPTGDERRALLARLDPERSGLVSVMQRLETDLGVIPVTPSELDWGESLLNADNRAWYRQVTEVVQSLAPAQREGLRLRHLEPVRWASRQHPSWLQMDKSSLADELRAIIQSRRRHERRTEGGERLSTWLPELPWGDVLAMLVVNDALTHQNVIDAFLTHAERDRADSSTEYGGVLSWTGDAWEARLYPPRLTQRFGDGQYVAPQELFDESDRSLAHFHLQVQEVDYAQYAGPSGGDFVFAENHARTCIVITSVGEGLINVDWYRGDGAAVDMGEFAGNAG